jgi:hypothetical protein
MRSKLLINFYYPLASSKKSIARFRTINIGTPSDDMEFHLALVFFKYPPTKKQRSGKPKFAFH